MHLTARVIATTTECAASVTQLEHAFASALIPVLGERPEFGKIGALAIHLSISHPAYGLAPDQRRSFHKPTNTYFCSETIDYLEWEAMDWPRRTRAFADAVSRAIRRVAASRLSDIERTGALEAIEEARDRVERTPPKKMEPVDLDNEYLRRAINSPPISSAPQSRICKLYKREGERLCYFEAWTNDVAVIEHSGQCGTRGETRTHTCSNAEEAEKLLGMLESSARVEGYRAIPKSRHAWLVVEFSLDDCPTEGALEFRYALEDHLNELTGWLGIGHCDGGSIGSGTLEAACRVVDYDIAAEAIARELKTSAFANYSRVYRESA